MSEQIEEIIARGREARRAGRNGDARGEFEAAVMLARQEAPALLIEALKGLGQAERDQGNLVAARNAYGEATALARRAHAPLLLAHTIRHLGDIHRHTGHPELAEPCLEEALQLYRDHGQPRTLDLANALRSLALLRSAQRAHEAARQHWSEARELYSVAGVEAGVLECSRYLSAADD